MQAKNLKSHGCAYMECIPISSAIMSTFYCICSNFVPMAKVFPGREIDSHGSLILKFNVVSSLIFNVDSHLQWLSC